MALVAKNSPANAEDTRDTGSISGLGRSPGEGNGNPLQYSCQEIPWTEKPGRLNPWVPKSWTWLSTQTHLIPVNNECCPPSATEMYDVQLAGFLFSSKNLCVSWLLPYLFGKVPQGYLTGCLSGYSTQKSLQIKDNSQLFDCVIFFPCQQWLPLVEKFLCAKLWVLYTCYISTYIFPFAYSK